MSQLDPITTTVGDLCTAALKESNAVGGGQTPLAEDMSDTQARMQWMLQQWARKRWMVWHLVTYSKVSTGAEIYTVGPGGDLDTNIAVSPFNEEFNAQFGIGAARTMRPARLESAFLTQLTQPGTSQVGPLSVDYPLDILKSMEDYNQIRLKTLRSFPEIAFYDTAFPLGLLHVWPIPQANIYSTNITVMEQIPSSFPSLASLIVLPEEYYGAIVYNLAIRLRAKYGIPSFPGDHLPGLAKDALNVIRGTGAQIARLRMPTNLRRPWIYNIFSDRSY